jgi:heme-degrading monooxygenase HmoA
MVLEVAILNVRSGQAKEFERAFATAQKIISGMPGYISHELNRCVEVDGKHLLLVRWNRLEDHTEKFRKSAEYQDWKRLLHHYYDPFPSVEHYETLSNKPA